MQGRKFLLSFPAPYTCDQLKARGLSSRLAQSASSTQHMCMVGAVGWEPRGSSPTTCAEKADHELPCHLPARDFFFYLSKGGFSLMRLSHLSRTFRRLVRNLEGRINSDWQDKRIFHINTESKNCHQQGSKKLHNICPHAFRAKGDSMCHVYPVEDCVKGLQGNLFKLPYT